MKNSIKYILAGITLLALNVINIYAILQPQRYPMLTLLVLIMCMIGSYKSASVYQKK